MSSHAPLIIDPEPLSGLKQLVNAIFLQATDVPQEVQSHLPSETVPVPTLLKFNLPNCLPKTTVLKAADLHASPLDPCWTIDALFKTSIPPSTWLFDLEQNPSVMWASGTHSIKPPLSPNPNLQFPMWIMNFWYMAVDPAEQRGKWRTAEDWLSRAIQNPEIRQARSLLDSLPWGLRLWPLEGHYKETRVGYLAELLSNEWLGERHIDILSSYLNTRAQGNLESRPISLVADISFYMYLSKNSDATAETIRAHRGLTTYTDRIVDQGYRHFFIPAHVGGNHWIVFSVDFEKSTFQYGELALLCADMHERTHLPGVTRQLAPG